MDKIAIGTSEKHNINIDLEILLRTRLLIQANSGGGFNNPLGRLRTLGLIDYPEAGRAVALPFLFLEN